MAYPCPLLVAGVYLDKNLMKIAGNALKANITNLGPLVLPISEQLLFFVNLVARKVGRDAGWTGDAWGVRICAAGRVGARLVGGVGRRLVALVVVRVLMSATNHF